MELAVASATPAGRCVDFQAPGGFCSPCGGRDLTVEIRYANEPGCIELVLLPIKGTNAMHVSPNIYMPYAPTSHTRSPRTKSIARQKPVSCVVATPAKTPGSRVGCSLSLLLACKDMIFKWRKTLSWEFQLWIGSSCHLQNVHFLVARPLQESC